MSAGSPDEDTSQSPPPRARDAAGEPGAGAANSAAGFLGHFNRIVMMVELIGRLPDLAEDVRNWRPRSLVEYSRDGAAIDGYGALSPVARHAFEAVVAGLNTLGSTAVTICENAGGRLSPDEIAACREIGVVMASLLERARALIETVEDSRLRAARPCADRSFQLKRTG
jgi:hypothetical protein